jgi:hypothetical protein
MGFFDFLGDVLTGGAISRRKAADAQHAQDVEAARALRIQKEQARQSREVAKSQLARSIDIGNQQRETAAISANDQSKAGAIEVFQAESAGLASLGVSGMAEGSTPYVSMETQIAEAETKLNHWFDQVNQNISIDTIGAGTSLESGRLNERNSIANSSILQGQIGIVDSRINEYDQNIEMNTILDIAGGVMKTAAAVYSMGTSLEAFKLMGGTDIFKSGGGNIFQLGGAVKYGQLTGDTSPLMSLINPPKIKPKANYLVPGLY